MPSTKSIGITSSESGCKSFGESPDRGPVTGISIVSPFSITTAKSAGVGALGAISGHFNSLVMESKIIEVFAHSCQEGRPGLTTPIGLSSYSDRLIEILYWSFSFSR